jgi:hypothetical protein
VNDDLADFYQRVEDVLLSEHRIDARVAMSMAGGPPNGHSEDECIRLICDAMDLGVMSGHYEDRGEVFVRE